MTKKTINGKTCTEMLMTIKAAADKNGTDHIIGTDALKAASVIERYPNVTTIELYRTYDYIICRKHNDKMKDLYSLSSCCLVNKRCLDFMKDETKICSKCFSAKQLSRYFNQYIKQAVATYFLSMDVLPLDCIPFLSTPSGLFRFESFGDVLPANDGGDVMAANYLNFARKNAHLSCAVWTKAAAVYAGPIAKQGKPDNFQFVYSDPFIDGVKDKAKFDTYIFSKYPFADKIFTVYATESNAKAAGFTVNCGGRSCATCRRCYTAGTEKNIVELKK